MIRVFYVHHSFGSATEHLFREALKTAPSSLSSPAVVSDYSRILYVATHAMKLRDAQKTFHRIVGESDAGTQQACYIPPDMVTLSGLSKRLYAQFGDRRIMEKPLVTAALSQVLGKGLGYAGLIHDYIAEMRLHYPDQKAGELRDYFRGIFDQCNIPETVSREALRCFDSMEAYESFMDREMLIDEEGLLCRCAGLLEDLNSGQKEGSGWSPETLIIDGFVLTSPAQRRILGELIQGAKAVFIAIPFDPDLSGLTDDYVSLLKGNFAVAEGHLHGSDRNLLEKRTGACYGYPDAEAEIEGIARSIKSLYRSGKFTDLERFIVTYPSLEPHSQTLRRVFKRYGIPFECAGQERLGKRRPFLDLLCLLRSVAEDYPRLAFAQFLSSPYFEGIPESLRAWTPLLSLRSGIISGKDSWLTLFSEGSEAVDLPSPYRSSLERDLQTVFYLLEPLEKVKCHADFSACVEAVKEVIDRLAFLETSEAAPEEAATGKTDGREEKRSLIEVLDHLSFLGRLCPGEGTLSGFVEMLAHLLNASVIEEESAGVKVMDLSDTMGISPACLYVGGLTDNALPGAPRVEFFLPDSVRKKAGLVGFDRYQDFRRFMFSRAVCSAGQVHLSYPLMEGDAVHLPSSFLYPATALEERIPGVFSREEYLVGSASVQLARTLSEVSVGSGVPAFGSHLKVTDVDAYRFCPRRFFVERVMNVAPLDIKEYEVEAITLGNVIHEIMERIIPEELGDFNDFRLRTEAIAEEVIGRKKIAPYWKELIRDSFVEILPGIYDKECEIRRSGYVSTVVEKPISGEPMPGIKLRGKIDRFDRIDDGIQIIDYKTGSATLTCSQVPKGGENLQLFLYAAMMKSHGYRVERVGLYSLKDIQIKWCPPAKRGKGRDEASIDEYITVSLRLLEDAVRGMRAGDFRARPLQDYNCRKCHEGPLCPYIQQ